MAKTLYLVAVDGSEWSERAADRAVSLAKQTGASVCFLKASEGSTFDILFRDSAAIPQEKRDEEEARDRAECLAPLEAKYAESGVEVSSAFGWGHPAEVIHNTAKEMGASMIFAGRRGRSRLGDLVLGSVANRLAHYTHVPVVQVP